MFIQSGGFLSLRMRGRGRMSDSIGIISSQHRSGQGQGTAAAVNALDLYFIRREFVENLEIILENKLNAWSYSSKIIHVSNGHERAALRATYIGSHIRRELGIGRTAGRLAEHFTESLEEREVRGRKFAEEGPHTRDEPLDALLLIETI